MAKPHDPEATTHGKSVSPLQFEKLREIFEAALSRPATDRQNYLQGACGGDRELLAEVQAMLRADEREDALVDHARLTPSSSAPEEGRFPAGVILAGRYRILGMLGFGGMGEVYRAYDQILNQTVALKFLTPKHISEAALVRFRNEVRIARQVSHPNVCRVYDLGMVEGLHFLSMEYIDGEDLASLLRRIGRLPQDKAVEFSRKICAGLSAAHERGVLHRDLKPANIMIDGRGHVRITDFGLAALAAEIPLSDLRSGTPAYMSPEQKAGKEVTVKSDLYSLGLVLHEMFTGKQRTTTQSNPSDFVKDLDPAIERLILRCLDEEPGRRPNSAFSVAMSLPGADPVAAALAAGETPSPEMVAASQEKEGLSARAAMMCFVAVVLCFVFGLWVSDRIGFLAHTPMPLTPEVLDYQAQQLLHAVGYVEEPHVRAYGFECCMPQVADLLRSSSRSPEVVSNFQSDKLRFWYRQHQKTFVSNTGSGAVRSNVPPHLEEGMIRLDLDPAGKLMQLNVRPWNTELHSGTIDWDLLFKASGLERANFAPADASSFTPSMSTDERFAWIGSPKGNSAIRVEAASWRGQPVYFSVLPQNVVTTTPASPSFPHLAYAPAVLIGLWFAWNNRRLGRGDRRGATVLAIIGFISALGMYVLQPAVDAPAWVPVFVPLFLWMYYTAAEPYVRRNWPDSLISWARLVAGKLRDPLVASHVLVGLLAGEAFVHVGAPLVLSTVSEEISQAKAAALGSTFDELGIIVSSIWLGLMVGLVLLVLAVVLRLAVRNLLLADAIAGVLVNVMNFLAYHEDWGQGGHGWRLVAGFVFLTLSSMIWLWLLRRFGFLAMMTLWLFAICGLFLPLGATGWIAERTIAFQLIPLVLAAWALWVILSSERQRTTEFNISL